MNTTICFEENLEEKRITPTLRTMELGSSQVFSLSKIDSVETLIRRVSKKHKRKFSTATDSALDIITVTRIL